MFGPKGAADVLREAFAPFEDFGVMGASTTTQPPHRRNRQHVVQRSRAPGIGLSQDPIEYGSYTWHTNLDTYERIVEDDVQKSAIAVAAAVYHLAMRDEMLPRFSKEDMPAAPAAPAGESVDARDVGSRVRRRFAGRPSAERPTDRGTAPADYAPAISATKASPRSSAFLAPTPLTPSSSGIVVGFSLAISRSVVSWKMT